VTVSRPQPASIREFLLGTLSQEECERLERDLLAEDDAFELLLATEEELLDECLAGSLADERAEAFLRYLTGLPGGRERMRFAKSLQTVLTPSREATSSPLDFFRRAGSWLAVPERLAWSAALLSVAVAGIWAGLTLPQRSPAGAIEPPAPAVVLTAGRLRGAGDMETVILSPGERLLELRLDLGSRDHQEYRAVLCDAESNEVFAASHLMATVTEERIFVAFALPSASLANGDYFIELEGNDGSGRGEPVGTYSLRLIVR